MRGQEGLQEDYDQALTALEATRAQLQHLERRARACALLHESLHRARDAARARYVRPFRDQVLALGRIVYGGGFDVDVDDDLAIASRTRSEERRGGKGGTSRGVAAQWKRK